MAVGSVTLGKLLSRVYETGVTGFRNFFANIEAGKCLYEFHSQNLAWGEVVKTHEKEDVVRTVGR